ncbi:2-deoxyglucose-6-phosphatase [Psychrosphaera saromensis]|uniref:HAD family hydrolase n=1 Tax=Psychrosphaera saromensis TaxID=716813 RepID=A0A2S7UTV9_9GAMM|nr:hexitol phosphatase HxpB [Psychrosphaera saromensis]PQJ52962.1 HAD family hydrolase [Psychrosphaera saromensis]GHB77567.1 2-deoxyglucose-6-phosphatase [Psychrosphaera saromensis]GLQ12879.1 2-deoxyglucose-6-phosphatase [Psychrosphaera saromensis]
MIQAVIFDMDGILIDSEAMWVEAEKQVFSSVGVEVTDELSKLTSSLTTKDVTDFWYARSPWENKSLEQVENEVIRKVEQLIKQSGQQMDGVQYLLDLLVKHKVKIGLSTNSPSCLTKAVLNKLDIAHYFAVTTSSDQVINGKPNPEVYLATAKKLSVKPEHCLVFEDSITGLTAAIAANMQVAVVPPLASFSNEKYAPAILKLRTLNEFSEQDLTRLIGRVD